MRILLRAFVLLDVLSLVFMAMQLWAIVKQYSAMTLLSDKVQSVLMFPMFVMLVIGIVGLFKLKKYGFVSYYIQFPFRLYLWVFTIGFITLLPEALSVYDDKWFPILLKICIAAEFVRLYLTIKAQLTVTKA
ncbi:MAG: hypothetical protein EOP00_30780 [Pedobacter sp.]|nr:MAG: hypothetical protein EOP00_30780 [Pedobacter sp.]